MSHARVRSLGAAAVAVRGEQQAAGTEASPSSQAPPHMHTTLQQHHCPQMALGRVRSRSVSVLSRVHTVPLTGCCSAKDRLRMVPMGRRLPAAACSTQSSVRARYRSRMALELRIARVRHTRVTQSDASPPPPPLDQVGSPWLPLPWVLAAWDRLRHHKEQ